MNEEGATFDYLIDYLSEDNVLRGLVNRVWTRSVPVSAAMPVVKVDVLDRDDLMGVGLFRVWADLAVLVRGITKSSLPRRTTIATC